MSPAGPPVYPDNAWEQIRGRYISNSPDQRSPENLMLVAKQFDVVNRPRYRPRPNGRRTNTYCNILVSDYTLAMCAAIPHWVDSPVAEGFRSEHIGRVELSAYGTIKWLQEDGPMHGWYAANQDQARNAAGRGCPVVVTWENPMHWLSPSHMAVVLPSPDADLMIMQAGAVCIFNEPIKHGFGSAGPLEFWTHG
jgi:hypothetical protein